MKNGNGISFEVEKMNSKEFNYIADQIKSFAGIHLSENEKNYSLVQNRMLKLMRTFSLSSYDELIVFLKEHLQDKNVKSEFVSALTTNKTDFFRESVHFDILLTRVKELLQKKSEIYIWSAACSIGAEPITIAIHLKENLPPADFQRLKILASDIDLQCLKTATEGFYSEQQMIGLSPPILNKYFTELAGMYKADDEILGKIHYSQLNLFDFPYKITKKFDFIFCRNVLIYFKPDDQYKIVDNLKSYLAQDGHLIIGLSETGTIRAPELKLINNSTYKKVA